MIGYFFTSESVCAGHPDKICDRISDAVVDAALEKDKNARVAVETLVTQNKVVIAGEVTCIDKITYESIVRREIKHLGYTDSYFNFSYKSPLHIYIHSQSPEIARGVDHLGAGDQGMMFGFACKETASYMPLPIELAHRLAQKIDEVREKRILAYLYPDGKTQVTVEYRKGKPYKVSHVVIAVPHKKEISLNKVKHDIYKHVVITVLNKYGFSLQSNNLIVNGTGVWHRGGPASDTGVTGRKIIVDTYGGYARVGGGCFSGKDPTKVDRSAAYAARFLAKNIVAHGLADQVEVRLAYFIGAKKPIMQDVETFGSEKTSIKNIRDFTHKLLDTSVEGILHRLRLKNPIYKATSSYGHFGRDEFPWEQIVNHI